MVEVAMKGYNWKPETKKKVKFYHGMQSWHLPQGHQLTYEPGFLHTAVVWGPGLIMVRGQIEYPFLKCHNPLMETTSENKAEKKPYPSERDLSILAWALSKAEKKKKTLLRISNQKPTLV